MLRQCAAHNMLGAPCNARPLQDGPYCRFHDPDLKAAVDEGRRLGGLRRRRETQVRAEHDFRGLRSPAEVLHLLEMMTSELLELPTSVAKARAIAYLASAAIPWVKDVEIEERLALLERATQGFKKAS
jgi:hypothetical protein